MSTVWLMAPGEKPAGVPITKDDADMQLLITYFGGAVALTLMIGFGGMTHSRDCDVARIGHRVRTATDSECPENTLLVK